MIATSSVLIACVFAADPIDHSFDGLAALASAPFMFSPGSDDDSLFALSNATSPVELAGDDSPPPKERFGTAGTRYWQINGALASNFDDEDIGRIGGGVGFFIADDFSLDLDLNVLGVHQDGPDAFGGGFNLMFRWHFLHNESRSWTIYGDFGAGLLVTTHDVPADGSSFNFTPQAGFGASFDVGDSVRLYTGLRWYHISNARLFDSNPAIDSGMVYAMLAWPF